MADAVPEEPAAPASSSSTSNTASVLEAPYTWHYYPVLGVLNGPTSGSAEPATTQAGEHKGPLTPYARQVARSILRYFRGGGADASAGACGWDSAGPARVPRWQTVSYERVDDIPRRKSAGRSGAGAADELSPRRRQGELGGEGLLTPRWVDKQQRRPATVVSLHALRTDDAGAAALGDELARNRVCLAAYGLTYAAVVIVSRAQAEDAQQADARLGAAMQRGGLDASQFFVCRAEATAAAQHQRQQQQQQQQQFYTFLSDLERRMYARASAYYADAFMRTQAKLAGIPQLPLPSRPGDAAAVGRSLAAGDGGSGEAQRLLQDAALVARFSRFLPLRAWLVRYHFKLAVFAECGGDRDTAQRSLWLAYAHLLAYVGEIASGAYQPAGEDPGSAEAAGPGWMWALSGGDSDGSRAHSLRMFGRRWDEALELLEAVHLRLVRGWLYQSLDAQALRSAMQQAPPISPVSRSGPRAAPQPATSAATSTSGGANGSLDALVLSVHAGECTPATEKLMEAERRRRLDHGGSARSDGSGVCFVALGSETADVDLLQAGAGAGAWWPLGGHFGVVDFGAPPARPARRPGLVLNSSLDASATAAQLPAAARYDAHLALAARQCVEHVGALAQALAGGGCGDGSSYASAALSRQHASHAALHAAAAASGVDFAAAFAAAASSPVLLPQWMWAATAAPMLQAAACARMRQQRLFAAEDASLGARDASAPQGASPVSSASPGVANAYVGAWLAAERAAPAGAAPDRARTLLTAALACLPGGSSADAAPDALVRLIEGAGPCTRQRMRVAGALADAFADAGHASRALVVVRALADRLRADGWARLAGHALQRAARYAEAAGDRHAAAEAAVELLAPQVADGGRALEDLRELWRLPPPAGATPAPDAVSVDMTRIHAAITCHAHWRHWRLTPGGGAMAFQVHLDCRALRQPLRLSELLVEFSDARLDVRVSRGAGGFVEAGGGVRLYDIRSARACDLELQPGADAVFEGCVDVGSAGAAPAAALVLVRVSAAVDGLAAPALRLSWPTCMSTAAAGGPDAGERSLGPMEALLASSAAVARLRDPALRVAPSRSGPAPQQRAAALAGPASSAPSSRRWLAAPQHAARLQARWLPLPEPPLQLPHADGSEPSFSAYSRCRVLSLPAAPEPGLVVTMPGVAALAPAYRGEALAVEIVVRNTHPRLPALCEGVDVRLASVGPADSAGLLDVDSASPSATPTSADPAAGDRASPWLSTQGAAGCGVRSAELLGLALPGGARSIQPGEERALTVFVHFPAAALSGACRSADAGAAVVRCAVRHTTDGAGGPLPLVASAQASIPVARPLHAEAEVLENQNWTQNHHQPLPPPASAEFCFRRPILVTLRNAGPWDVVVEQLALRPPAADALADALAAAGCAALRVEIAQSTTAEPPSAVVLPAGGALKHVFWVSVHASDIIRLPSEMCPGVLDVTWRRRPSHGNGDDRNAAGPVRSCLWMRPVRLVARRLQVGSECSVPVARVGQPLTVCYRVTNPTRRTRTLDATMHASDAFVFAGPRRSTLTVLPGLTAVLRFTLLPLSAAASSGSAAYAPGHAVLGPTSTAEKSGGNVTGQGWVLLPRLEIKCLSPNPAAPSSTNHAASSSSSLQPAAPPPTRAAPSAVFGSLPSSPAVTGTRGGDPAKTMDRAQQIIVDLAAELANNDQAPTDRSGAISPGLAQQCVGMLPACLLHGASVTRGCESDFETSDNEDGDDACSDAFAADTGTDDGDDEILRLDQTAIYCLPH